MKISDKILLFVTATVICADMLYIGSAVARKLTMDHVVQRENIAIVQRTEESKKDIDLRFIYLVRIIDSLDKAEKKLRRDALSAGYQNSLFFQMGLNEFEFDYSHNTFKIGLKPGIRGRIAQYDEFGNRTVIKPPPPTKSDKVKEILEGRNRPNFGFIF